ncbi:MAG: sulfatase [Planctomycetes bacterium]|nr:sulfatase [Planctomycetota bacterium]
MTNRRARLGATPFLTAGVLAGFVLAMVEVTTIACWHPGRQPLELHGLDWIGSGTLVCLTYAGFGLFHGSVLALCFRRALARRGRTADDEARRLTGGTFLWIFGTALVLWIVRQAWPGGFEALPIGRTALGLLAATIAGMVAVLLGEFLVRWQREAMMGVVLVTLVGGSLAWFRWTRDEPSNGARANAAPEATSVVLVIADALRADRIGAYARIETPGQVRTTWGERPHAETPNLDRLAREGTTFERFFVQAPFTWGSFASWFTGLHASEHGLLAMDPATRLAHRVGTVAEAFRARGYRTAAFLAGTLTNGSGLARGFECLFEKTAGRGPFHPEDPTSALFAELFPMRWLVRRAAHGDREIVVSEATRFVRRQGQQPFFVVVHLFGTHTPYDPPRAWRIPGTEESPAFDFARARAIEEGEHAPASDEREDVRALYDGCVQWVDHQVGRIIAELERAGRLEHTELWVSADHGEELFDHRVGGRFAVEHDWMWNTNLRVPLIVRGPGWGADRRVPEVHSSVEWSRELAHRHGLAGFEGADRLGRADGKGIALSENHLYRAAQDERFKLLVERTGERRAFLFDLFADPLERTPLEDLDVAARAARERLAEALAPLRVRERAAARGVVDAEGHRAFDAYGYLGGARLRDQVRSR